MNKIQCPNCKNYKIKSSKATAWALLVIGIATIIFGIGIIFLLMGFVAFPKKQNIAVRFVVLNSTIIQNQFQLLPSYFSSAAHSELLFSQ